MIGRAAAALLLSLVLVSALAAPGQGIDQGGAAGTGQDRDRWTPRLERLRPERPMGYFELAEEVADAARTAEERELARHLFALAGALDRHRLGRSAALALADLAGEPRARRRLLALAALLDDDSMLELPESLEPGRLADADPTAALALSEAFSAYRRGDGRRALSALDKPGAMELLESVGHVLRGGADRFLEDCRSYHGQSRPPVTERQFRRMLQIEEAVLAGDDRSWSSDLLLRGSHPLLEIDPQRIEQTLEVDPSRPYSRDGRWVAAPAG